MGLFKWLFGRKKKVEENPDWEHIEYQREGVDFHREEDRSRYITDCLEQMAEGAKELDLLSGEYSLVTAYLTDMEEIESLPVQEREEINVDARKLVNLDRERRDYLDKKGRMDDGLFYSLKSKENELEEGITKIKEAEEYAQLIKQDLQRLDGERHAYSYRKSELYGMLANFKGMAVIFITALIICVGLLAVLQFAFKMETQVGYFIAVVSGSIAIAVMCVKFMDAQRELQRVEKAINRLVQLQNKVKIRYVNNTNLLDYLYVKYQVESGKKLEKLYKQYLSEKEERRQYQEAEAKREFYIKSLLAKLERYRVRYPERLMGRVEAFLSKDEMVECRHELIVRRQALRKQMEYNNQVIARARDEIMDVAKSYPKYATEILEMVERFEKEFHV